MTVLFLCLAACQAAGLAPQATPTTSGCTQAGEIVPLEIDSLTRGYSYRVNLYLPPCYQERTEAYAVVYLIPGRGSGNGAWFAAGANEVADGLIQAGSLPPFLMVATENTDGDPQGETIFKDVVPYIESHYRVLADRRHRAVAGGSLGGIAAYRLAFLHPETFSSAGLFGSGVISGEEATLQTWLAALTEETRVRVFLSCGDQDTLMLERAQAMTALLDAAQIPYVYQTPKGGHNYATWVSSMEEYFQWLAQEW